MFSGETVAGLRHDLIGVESRHEMDQTAPGAVARNDDRTIFAALKGNRFDIEPQSSTLHGRSMAGITALGKDGLDVLNELYFLVGRGRQRLGCSSRLLNSRISIDGHPRFQRDLQCQSIRPCCSLINPSPEQANLLSR